MNRGVTIYDVARAADVSIATVSNAMNRPTRVAATTRARVFEAADQLGYVPHAIAAHRARTRRERIGIIAPFTTYPSYAHRTHGMFPVLDADHIEAIILDHPSASRSPSPRLAALPLAVELDGLVIMGVPVDVSLAERLRTRELPTVLVDSGHPQFTSVILDEEAGARAAARHLLERGYERFVYITEGQRSSDYISQGLRRANSFGKALSESGVSSEHVQIMTARAGDVVAGRAAAEPIAALASRQRVGVLAGHDMLAAGVVAGLRAQFISVPDRIGVIGWDGGEMVEALGLTTVQQPLAESGRIGASRLMALMRDPSQPVERVVLTPSLVVGTTT